MKRLQTFTALLLVGTVAFASRPDATAPEPASAAHPPGTSSDPQAEGLAFVPDASIDIEPIAPDDPEIIAATPPAYELTLICAPFHCEPCEVAKANRVPWIEAYGYSVTVCTADDDDNVHSFPTWVVTLDGVEVHRWTGESWTPDGTAEFNRNLGIALGRDGGPVLAAAPTANSLKEWIADHYGPTSWGNWTHPDTIYNHLVNGHGWSPSDLEGLSNREMNCLHDACHEGRISANGEHHAERPVSAPRVYSSSNCPSGRCPAPSRRGPLRRLFNF